MTSQAITTMPLNQSESPILAHRTPVSGVTPVYVWKHGKTMFLSVKEDLIAKEFLKTRNYASCVRKLKVEMGYEISPVTVKRWLERGHIKEWLAEQFDELGVTSGWTKEHWLKVMTDHLQGKERLKNGDLYAMKLIGDHKGWGGETPQIAIGEINVVQSNGRA